MSEEPQAPASGAVLVNVAFAGTGLVVGTSVAAALLPDTFGLVHAALSCALFAVGTAALLWAYALGVSRSRSELVSIAGLFFLAGDAAPMAIKRPLRVALAVEIVAVVVAAVARPYTEVAFGILAPMFAMGLMSAWGGRHGAFPPRPPKSSRTGAPFGEPASHPPRDMAP